MSVFLGWIPDAATQAALAAVQQEWQAHLPEGAPRHDWRTPAQWHLTLRYLGQAVTDAQRAAIDHAMRGLVDGPGAPAGRLEGAQYWPHANVLVARIAATEALMHWLKRIEAAMQACGFAEVRGQVPHITLAHLPGGTEPPSMAASLQSPSCEIQVRRIDLLRTVSGGYSALACWRLGADTAWP